MLSAVNVYRGKYVQIGTQGDTVLGLPSTSGSWVSYICRCGFPGFKVYLIDAWIIGGEIHLMSRVVGDRLSLPAETLIASPRRLSPGADSLICDVDTYESLTFLIWCQNGIYFRTGLFFVWRRSRRLKVCQPPANETREARKVSVYPLNGECFTNNSNVL